MLPPISCWCPTYGRVNLLEEAIECFLRQDYKGKKELVILNDYPGVIFKYDHPEVKIINSPTRFPSLGHKFNRLFEECRYDVFVQWMDDDIQLPWTLTTQMKYFTIKFHQDVGMFALAGFMKWDYREKGTHITWEDGVFYGYCTMTRQLWEKMGRWEEGLVHAKEDIIFSIKLKNKGLYRWSHIKPHEVYYIWRVKIGDYSLTDDLTSYEDCKKRVDKTLSGEIMLEPHWDMNYVDIFGRLLRKRFEREGRDFYYA